MPIYILLITLFLTLTGCNNTKNSDEGTTSTIFGAVQPPAVCTETTKKQFVYDLMHDSYLWASETVEMSDTQIASYASDSQLLDALKVENDHFSYILDKSVYQNYLQSGIDTGYGFLLKRIVDSNDTTLYFVVKLVFPESPADISGLKRGDLIAKIDHYSVDKIFNDETLLDTYFNHVESDQNTTFTLSDDRNLTIISAEFDLQTVLYQTTFEQNGTKIGYLTYQSFIETSEIELSNAFTNFKAQGIDELILDLRYNGGGYIKTAKYLATLIGGQHVYGTVFNKTLFNEKYSLYNQIMMFDEYKENALDLDRVFIITTNSTASASELVINAFRASTNDVEVIQIGSSTYGKPYGMIGGVYCDRYILPIQVESVNGDESGGYVDGLVPTCSATDDLYTPLGDLNETSIHAALYYIQTGECEPTAVSTKSRTLTPYHMKDDVLRGFKKAYGVF